MSKFTAAELVEFYQKVADGGVIEVSHADNVWRTTDVTGPSPVCFKKHWRIKPAKKHDHIEELQELVATIRNDGELTDIVLHNVCVALEDFVDTVRMEIRDDDWS